MHPCRERSLSLSDHRQDGLIWDSTSSVSWAMWSIANIKAPISTQTRHSLFVESQLTSSPVSSSHST